MNTLPNHLKMGRGRKAIYLFIIMLFPGQFLSAQHAIMHATKVNSKSAFSKMMDTMMINMNNAHNETSVAANFITTMIPHHQGAIEMANFQIRYGKDFRMIQLAKNILFEQMTEVQQMRLLSLSIIDTTKTTAAFHKDMSQTMDIMMQSMPNDNKVASIDQAFARVMIPHHKAAIDMARVVIKFTREQSVSALAKSIISSQQVEILQMSSFLKN